EEVAKQCAQRLAKIDASATYINLGDAVENCARALVNRKEEVRIPAAQFLGNVDGGGNPLAAQNLLAVFQDAGAPVELRRVALRSLGRAAKDGTVGATNLFDVYLKAEADADQE